MTGLPDLLVELDDGTGTWPYDVTPYVRLSDGFQVVRGRTDEFADVQPSTLDLAFANHDGRFTQGSPEYGCYVDQPIRLSYLWPSAAHRNLVPSQDASLEGAGVGSWTAGGTVPPTLTNSTARAYTGTHSLLVTWGAGGTFPQAALTVTGLTVATTYTASAYVWVPSGSPAVTLWYGGVAGDSSGSKFDQWVRLTAQKTATATSHGIQLLPNSSPTAGQLAYLDGAMVNAGTAAGEFNTLTQATFRRFTGYVQQWPVEWAAVASYAMARVSATDRMPRWSRRRLKSPLWQALEVDSPTYHWPLSEKEGARRAASVIEGTSTVRLENYGSVLASTAAEQAAAYVQFGQSYGSPTDGGTAPVFTYDKKYLRSVDRFTPDASFTIEAVVTQVVTSGTANLNVLEMIGTDGSAFIEFNDTTNYRAQIEWVTPTSGGSKNYTGAADLSAGSQHHVAITVSGSALTFYLDGVAVGSLSSVGTGSFSLGTAWRLRVGRYTDGSGGEKVAICHVAYFDSALTAGQVADHAAAALTGFLADSSDERIARYLGYAGVAPGDMVLEAGVQAAVPNLDTSSLAVAEAVKLVERAEGGLLFVDGDNKVVFYNRQHRVLQTTPALAITAEDCTGGLVPVNDTSWLINQAEITPTDGTVQIASDAASIAIHEQYPRQEDLLLATEDEALAVAQWLTARYADADTYPRVGVAPIDLLSADVQTAYDAAAVELWDRVQISGMPDQSPLATLELIAEGWVESMSSADWTLTLNASPFSQLGNVWVLEDATYGALGATTVLHY